ncbi:MAG: mercury(II) reductase [Deferrisomatales bacterium]|nr:mercury(II) reductase [Deferrisomatales bacterium]
MNAATYELVILGGGAAAFAAATEADRRGLRTAMVNDGLPIGGTCVNVGCMPTKHLLAVAKGLRHPAYPPFGSTAPTQPGFDFPRAVSDKDALVETLRQSNYRDVLGSFQGVQWVEGHGVLVDARTVAVGDRRLTGEKVLIATGSTTLIPPVEGLGEVGYLTNVEALSLEHLPGSLFVLGGGPLGLEFAQIFHRMGSHVTVVELVDRILERFEPEVSAALKAYLEREGIEILTGTKAVRVRRTGRGRELDVDTPDGPRTLLADEIFVATGVRGNIDGIGLGAAGVETHRSSFVKVDEFLRTNVPHIYAAGDVTGRMGLETVAAKQGKIAVENAFGDEPRQIDLLTVPSAVFTDPEVASVGMTEARLMAERGECDCRTVTLEKVARAVAVGDTRGLVKLVAEPDTGKVLGVHVVSPVASEMIHEGVLAVKLGLTVDELIDTVHVFPTYTEAIKIAAQAFRRDVSTMSCCVE